MKRLLLSMLLILALASPVGATKVQDLTADTTPGTDSLLYTVDDPGGTPAGRKSTIGQVLVDGNIPNTITIDTATALSSDPSNCASSGLAGGITANGTAEACITPNAGTDITADLEEEGVTCTDCVSKADLADDATEATKCIVIETPADADDLLFFRANSAITVTSLDCIVESATSAVVVVVECDSAGDNCGTTRLSESMTCDVDGATDDGTIGNAGVVAGAYIRAQVGTVTGTPGHVAACFTFTRDD